MAWIKLDPITRRRFARFRQIKRGYYSFLILLVAIVLSIFAPFLAELLDDDYAAVRYIAGKSLQQLPGYETFQYDYVGSKPSRQEARRRALQIWNAAQSRPDRAVGHDILIEASGLLMQDKVRQLMDQRDPRSLFLGE